MNLKVATDLLFSVDSIIRRNKQGAVTGWIEDDIVIVTLPAPNISNVLGLMEYSEDPCKRMVQTREQGL